MAKFPICILLALATTTVLATPLPGTPTAAKRFVPSGGVNCYFECPASITSTEGQTIPLQESFPFDSYPDSARFCEYNIEPFVIEGYAVCIYDGKGTILEDQYLDGASETCVQQLTSTFCGSTPANDQQFRRSLTPRGLTDVEKRIANRQWKPSKAAPAKLVELDRTTEDAPDLAAADIEDGVTAEIAAVVRG